MEEGSPAQYDLHYLSYQAFNMPLLYGYLHLHVACLVIASKLGRGVDGVDTTGALAHVLPDMQFLMSLMTITPVQIFTVSHHFHRSF